MPSKKEYQDIIKARFGINKNISSALSKDECAQMLELLEGNQGSLRLVQSFIGKNNELANNNKKFGLQRHQAEKGLIALKEKHEKLLKGSARSFENNEELNKIKEEMKALRKENSSLKSNNEELMRDNRNLKNIVDFIKLRTTQGIKRIISKPENQLRKELAKFLESTLG